MGSPLRAPSLAGLIGLPMKSFLPGSNCPYLSLCYLFIMAFLITQTLSQSRFMHVYGGGYRDMCHINKRDIRLNGILGKEGNLSNESLTASLYKDYNPSGFRLLFLRA